MSADDLALGDPEEEEEKPEPRIFKPDLYEAAMQNDTQKVFTFLEEQVPPTHVDEASGWTPLHWAAKHGNVQMAHLLIEFGASAPYHRMVNRAARAKQKAEEDAAAAAKKANGGANYAPPDVKEEGGEGEEGGENAAEDKGEGGPENKESDAAATTTEGTTATETAEAKTEADSKAADGASDDKKDGKEIEDSKDASASDVKDAASGDKEGAKDAAVADEKKGGDAGDVDMDEDDDDLDYETAMDRKAETSVDLTKNTPLLWAATKGYLRVVWLLLLAGYNPNDLDDLENNALHLAACGGNPKVCQVLLDSGAKSTLVNAYKNLPIDMTVNGEIRDIIADGMEKGASMTAADIEAKHTANVEKYVEMTSKLEAIIKKADKPSRSPAAISETIATLMETLAEGREWGLDLEMISTGERLVKMLEMGQVLMSELKVVQDNLPIRTQEHFSKYVSRLESAIVGAKELGLDEGQISSCENIVARCGLEYWVSVLTERLKPVECATDIHEHDMKRLEQAIDKAQVHGASDEIMDVATELHKRLSAELGMSRALLMVPTYRLPKKEGEEVPDGYWQPEDVGHIDDTTEGFPHPPPETGEYVWHPSECFTKLTDAIAAIKASYGGAEEVGANPDVVAKAKAALVKCEKDHKQLSVKNEADKQHAIEVTHKSIKKKGKKKK
jgi:ankyrin repeat protein